MSSSDALRTRFVFQGAVAYDPALGTPQGGLNVVHDAVGNGPRTIERRADGISIRSGGAS